MYCCHRSKCGRAGRIDSDSNGSWRVSASEEPPKKEPRIYTGTTVPVGEDNLKLLSERFGLAQGELDRWGVLEDQRTRACVVPIRGPYGESRGVSLRKFEPKWNDIYRDPASDGQPLLGWLVLRQELKPDASLRDQPVVLLEDAFSAIKCARQFGSVILFGTHINLGGMLEVVKETDNIVLALDRDAYDKAVKLKQRFNYIAPSMRVVRLERDLKYESDERIKAIVEGTDAR